MLLEVDGSVICTHCDRSFPPNLDVCPDFSCLSYEKNRLGMTAAVIGGVPSSKFCCKKCGKQYSSNNCLRLPYVWYFQKLDEMNSDQAEAPRKMIE